MNSFFVVIFGPTGVGKTAYALELGNACSQNPEAPDRGIEIINADMGQLYEPLAIGTAKPDWKHEVIPHRLFDIVKEPVHYSAYHYRQACLEVMQCIRSRGRTPVIVGGTGFYVRSLFFPLQEPVLNGKNERPEDCVVPINGVLNDNDAGVLNWQKLISTADRKSRWDLLASIDPVRAQALHPHDVYRVERALEIWREKGILPSSLKPEFQLPEDPNTAVPGNCYVLFLDRQTEDLYERIDRRVVEMIDHGWIDEVARLPKAWHEFLSKKKLIGYPEIVDFIKRGARSTDLVKLIASIQQQTRVYARRQRIFWRGLKKTLQSQKSLYAGSLVIEEINLTLSFRLRQGYAGQAEPTRAYGQVKE